MDWRLEQFTFVGGLDGDDPPLGRGDRDGEFSGLDTVDLPPCVVGLGVKGSHGNLIGEEEKRGGTTRRQAQEKVGAAEGSNHGVFCT